LTLNTQSVEVTKVSVADGKAMVTVDGGSPPYSYSWSNGATSGIADNLSPGNYTVTVTDAAGCSANKPVNVDDVDCSDIIITLNREHGKCGGAIKGYILSEIENAVSPLSYNWNNNSNTAYIENASFGSYKLTVTDARGCSRVKSRNVTNGSSLSVSLNGSDLSAFNSNDGSASLSVNGGSSPYTYKWSTGATSTSINNLTPGVYEVLATDANGCIAKENITIEDVDCAANNFKAGLIYENVNCRNGNDGFIRVNPSGGYSPYSYSWTGSNTSSNSRSNLSQGTYSMEITDSKNCSISASQTISHPTNALSLSVAKTNETYFNESNGSATANASGGTPPYQYNWSSGAGGSKLNALSGGAYTVRVLDANGCSATKSFSIAGINCDNIALNVNSNDALCYGVASGTASASATGGSSPYTISWTNNDVGNTADNFPTGVYEAYVIDNVGCSTYRELTIDEATELNFNLSETDVSYYGQNNGAASVTASNGTPPYTYSWDNGASTGSINNLAPGSYTVTITDSNNCNRSAQAIVEDVNCNNIKVNNLFVTDISCYGEKDGRIVAQMSGGSTPYTYNWSTGQTTGTITGLSDGSYTLNATGSKGCPASKTVTVSEPAELQINLTTSNESIYGENDGSAGINVNGGIAPYTISWSDGSSNLFNNNLAMGNYSLEVEDSNNCQFVENFTIEEGCRKVYNLLANGVTNSSAIINWNGDENDGTYNLQYRNVSDGGPWQTLATSQNSILLTNLKACKTYEFGIYSDCDSSNGVFVRFTTGGCTACTASTNLYTLNVTEQSAFLNWDIYPAASYILYYRAKGANTWFEYETDFSFAILFGLDDCKDYEWYIKTNCNVGLSPNSASQEFTTGCNKNANFVDGKSLRLIDKVYPNPVIDQLVVEHAYKTSNSTEFEIYDVAGLLHFKGYASGSQSELDLAHLPKGLFTLYIKQADAVEAVKFVKE